STPCTFQRSGAPSSSTTRARSMSTHGSCACLQPEPGPRLRGRRRRARPRPDHGLPGRHIAGNHGAPLVLLSLPVTDPDCKFEGVLTEQARLLARWSRRGLTLPALSLMPRACAPSAPGTVGEWVIDVPPEIGANCPSVLGSIDALVRRLSDARQHDGSAVPRRARRVHRHCRRRRRPRPASGVGFDTLLTLAPQRMRAAAAGLGIAGLALWTALAARSAYATRYAFQD